MCSAATQIEGKGPTGPRFTSLTCMPSFAKLYPDLIRPISSLHSHSLRVQRICATLLLILGWLPSSHL